MGSETKTLPWREWRVIEEVKNLEAQVLQVYRTLRSITDELRPSVLIQFGLEAAIRGYAEDCRINHPDVQIMLEMPEDGQELPDWISLSLFRICQQAMQNALKHGGPSHIWIHLNIHEDMVLLEVTDDGRGFTAPRSWVELVRAGHLGIAGMAERTEEIGGSFILNSTPGQGTTVRVTLPLLEGSSPH